MSKLGKLVGMAASGAVGIASGAIYGFVKQEKRIDLVEEQMKKLQCFQNLLEQWLSLKQDGKNLKEYFEFNGYHTVAIYGMTGLGRCLLEELRGTDIEVKYVVDRNADNIEVSFPKFKPEDKLEKVDAMVITAIYYYQGIVEDMEKKVDFPLVSLEDVVYGLS